MNNTDYAYFTYTLLAGASRIVSSPYNYFRLFSVSGADSLSVRFGDNSPQIFEQGVAFKAYDVLDKIEIVNVSGVSVTFTFALAVGEIHDNRFQSTANIEIAIADTWDFQIVDVDTEVYTDCLVPARSTRKSVLIKNSGTANLYFNPTAQTGTTPTGYKLAVGAEFIFNNTADIFCYKDTSASGQEFEFLEEYS